MFEGDIAKEAEYLAVRDGRVRASHRRREVEAAPQHGQAARLELGVLSAAIRRSGGFGRSNTSVDACHELTECRSSADTSISTQSARSRTIMSKDEAASITKKAGQRTCHTL
jgi:hypothetical protein